VRGARGTLFGTLFCWRFRGRRGSDVAAQFGPPPTCRGAGSRTPYYGSGVQTSVLRPRLGPRLRRALAAVLAAALMVVTGVEPLFADTCDGDAPAAAVAAVAAHADLPSPTAAADRTPANSDDTRGAPVEHIVHLCHCTHVHGGLDQVGYEIEAQERPLSSRLLHVTNAPPSDPALEAPLRPPALTLV